MSEPNRYRIADNQVQRVYGGNILVVDPAGPLVEYADYARLKAEVERYKFTLEEERQIARQDWAGLRCEHDRVKRALEQAEAEVERIEPELEQRCRELNLSLGQQAVQLRQIGDLKAEVERLRKAGDWMCGLLRFDFVTKEWNAAKEGKQS